MKSYRTLAFKELLAQKMTSFLILAAIILSTAMTTVIGSPPAFFLPCGSSRPSRLEATVMRRLCR